MTTFPTRLKELRTSSKLSQQALADALGLSKSSVAMYEVGAREPNFETMESVADFFNVDMNYLHGMSNVKNTYQLAVTSADATSASSSLSPEILRIARAYEKATPPVQRTVEVALEPFMEKDNVISFPQPEEEIAEEVAPELTSLKTYTQPSAAGLGNYLDDDSYDVIDYPNVPTRANIAVRITGDSMEPKFYDGDIVFVETESVLDDGEIGIFCYDGQGFIKKIRKNPGRLVSLNPRYKDIPLRDGFGFRVVGRVVGVANR